MAAEPKPERISEEEYLEFERASEFKHDYIDGHMCLLAGGTRNHSELAGIVNGALRSRLRGTPCRTFTSDVRVRIDGQYFYADVTVSCDERDGGEGDDVRFPCVIFEVLSPSTEAYDRGDKFDLYQACPTLTEYVLVNNRRPEIQVFRRDADGWTLKAFRSGDEVELSSLSVRIAVDEIYEGIELVEDRRLDVE